MRSKPGAALDRKRVLLIYKKSAYQVYVREQRNERIRSLIRSGDRATLRLLRADRDHQQSVAAARKVLDRLGVESVFRFRSDADTADAFDLVVTLGGDGTLLWASQFVGPNTPMIAINTAPKDSVGYLCGGTKGELGDVLGDALRGRLTSTILQRMRVDLDQRTLSRRVLNDALFCHCSPAATSRYQLVLRGVREEQKSSGFWIGPAAGSTAAQRSAGGRVLPPTSKRLQLVVREPYAAPGARVKLKRALLERGEELRARSLMRAGELYVDGSRRHFPVEMGQVLRFKLSEEPLTLLGYGRGALRSG